MMAAGKQPSLTVPTETSYGRDRLKEFSESAHWYHCITFPSGITTKGVYNHDQYLHYYGFPESLAGLTVLDVGAADGYFSFEFERRGAANVLAIDTNPFDGSVPTDVSLAKLAQYESKYDSVYQSNLRFGDVYESLAVPVGNNLMAARAILGSKIEYRNLSVYDLHALDARYDVVFVGDLIEHLKNPIVALENLAAVTGKVCIISLSNVLPSRSLARPDGESSLARRLFLRLLSSLGVQIANTSRGIEYHGEAGGGSFFHFFPQTFRRALLASGFGRVEIKSLFELPHLRTGVAVPHAIFHCYQARRS
jgi:2-polyprenyl-3-methyl-5-hydroxy-6-metoxy-1,4-benzoquinol methylase